MKPEEAAYKEVEADLKSARFRAGLMRRWWRMVSFDFPILVIAVSAIEPDGSASEYAFRFELTGFRSVPPEVKIWDLKTNALLAENLRPKGSERTQKAFQKWDPQTVYRPWDRHGISHGDWLRSFPNLIWHPQRDLTFILEDLHGLLNSNSLAQVAKAVA